VGYVLPCWCYWWEDIFARGPDPRCLADEDMRGRREVFKGAETSSATRAHLILSERKGFASWVKYCLCMPSRLPHNAVPTDEQMRRPRATSTL
jgi:hypothetical protein